jgi:hypothetical protein
MAKFCIAPLFVALSVTAARASPGGVAAEATYTSGTFDNSETWTLGLHVDAEYVVSDPVLVSASGGVIHASVTNEGEEHAETAITNPSLLVHYRLRSGVWELRAKTGFVLGNGYTFARLVGGAYEAPRRPYDFAPDSAVPLLVTARATVAKWSLETEGGAYFISDDGPQLDAIHVAVGGAYREANLGFTARLHALFVPAESMTPPYQERSKRAYFGAEVGVDYLVGRYLARVSLYKPFGYDEADLTNRGTAVCVGVSVAL